MKDRGLAGSNLEDTEVARARYVLTKGEKRALLENSGYVSCVALESKTSHMS